MWGRNNYQNLEGEGFLEETRLWPKETINPRRLCREEIREANSPISSFPLPQESWWDFLFFNSDLLEVFVPYSLLQLMVFLHMEKMATGSSKATSWQLMKDSPGVHKSHFLEGLWHFLLRSQANPESHHYGCREESGLPCLARPSLYYHPWVRGNFLKPKRGVERITAVDTYCRGGTIRWAWQQHVKTR